MKIRVYGNKFHDQGLLWEGTSEKQAIRIARKYDCHECKCGGPSIVREDGSVLVDWQAAKPFCTANDPRWEEI